MKRRSVVTAGAISAPVLPIDFQEHRDRRLLGRVADGDEVAFVEIVRRYGPAALGVASRLVVDVGLAEEVLQEVFVSIWKRSGVFDVSRGSVRSWILTQVHHRAVDVVRREEAQRRRNTVSVLPDPVGITPDDVIEERWLVQRRERVRDCLSRLSDNYRQVIVLTYFEGLTQAQAADRLGIPVGTVKSRTFAAMKHLNKSLKGTMLGAE